MAFQEKTVLAGRRIAVVMPAYNEAKLIAGALDGIPSFVDHIIVVDDASLDATSKIVRAFPRPIELTEHAVNQGVGAAIATGCRHALSLDADLTAVMAADGQMDPMDLPALLAPLIAGEADYTHGNRLGWPAAREVMPWHRWLGNHFFSSLTRYAIGVEVQDSQCGYAAMNNRTSIVWHRVHGARGAPYDKQDNPEISVRFCRRFCRVRHAHRMHRSTPWCARRTLRCRGDAEGDGSVFLGVLQGAPCASDAPIYAMVRTAHPTVPGRCRA